MIRDPHYHKEQDPEALRKLAAEIAQLIVNGDLLEPRKEELFAARRVCPPNKLCCWAGYRCTTPFFCDEYFGCINFFSGGVKAVQPERGPGIGGPPAEQ